METIGNICSFAYAKYGANPCPERLFRDQLIFLSPHGGAIGYLFPWLTTISTAIYLAIGMSHVISGEINSGTFIATLGIFKEAGDDIHPNY